MKGIFQPAADKFELYAKAAFTTLSKIFENVGKTFGFVINDFFADNKLAIITALAVGVGLMGGVTLGAGAIAGVVAGLGAGLVLGKATSNLQSPDSLQNTINTLDRLEQLAKGMDDNEIKRQQATRDRYSGGGSEPDVAKRKKAGADLKMIEADNVAKFDEAVKIQRENPLAGIDLEGNDVGFRDPTGSRRKMLGELRDKKLKERKEAFNFNPAPIFNSEVNKNSPVNLKQDQLKNAKIIYEEFIKAGYNDTQAKAAIANAQAESQLNATIQSGYVDKKTGVREESYGLFQINRKSHPQYSVEDLKDARKNTQAIIEIMANKKKNASGTFRRIMDGANATEFFMKYVEEPKDQTDPKVLERINYFNKIKGIDLSSSSTELNDNTRAAAAGNSSGAAPVTAVTNNSVKNSQAVVATRVGMDDKSLQQAMALF
jgi:hypothetical protein